MLFCICSKKWKVDFTLANFPSFIEYTHTFRERASHTRGSFLFLYQSLNQKQRAETLCKLKFFLKHLLLFYYSFAEIAIWFFKLHNFNLSDIPLHETMNWNHPSKGASSLRSFSFVPRSTPAAFLQKQSAVKHPFQNSIGGWLAYAEQFFNSASCNIPVHAYKIKYSLFITSHRFRYYAFEFWWGISIWQSNFESITAYFDLRFQSAFGIRFEYFRHTRAICFNQL